MLTGIITDSQITSPSATSLYYCNATSWTALAAHVAPDEPTCTSPACIESKDCGVTVPIPTLPASVIRMRSPNVPAVLVLNFRLPVVLPLVTFVVELAIEAPV